MTQVIKLGLIGVVLLLGGACSTSSITPSASVTTLEPVWPQYFTLTWSNEPAVAGGRRITGYVYSNSKGFPARNMQVLTQAIDASGSVIGQRIDWVTGVLPPNNWLFFTVGALPPAEVYRLSVWHFEFLQAPGGGAVTR